MMSNTKLLVITILTSSLVFYSACREKTVIRSSNIPAVDNINTFYTDTNTIICNNIITDSFQTGGYKTDKEDFPLWFYCGLGSINNDPIFGGTTASIAFQVRQPNNLLKFPSTNIVTDSLILSIPYRAAFGDTINSTPQTFNLYRLVDTLPSNQRLYNNTKVNYDPTLLGSATLDFKHMDSVLLKTGKAEPQLRIALSPTFANMLLNLKDTGEYKNALTFKTWLKGFYLTPADTNSGNAIGYFYMYNAKLTYHFRSTSTTGKIDTLAYVYKLDEANCTFYNNITRNFTKANANAIPQYVNTGNTKGDSILYTQGDFGAAIDIKFPYIHKFENAIINQATIELTVIPSGNDISDSAFKKPRRLFTYKIISGKEESVYKDVFNGLADGYGRPYYQNGVKKYRYLLNISHEIQKAITLQDSTIRLRVKGINNIVNFNFQGSGRATFGGTNKRNDKVKLNIIYTKLK